MRISDWSSDVCSSDLLDQVNDLTRRVYDLLDRIRVMGFVAGGGDIGSAVQTALAEGDSSAIIIPVPGAALTATGGAANMIAWLPRDVIATTITGMIEARAQLFADFDRLSGLSDHMRGEIGRAHVWTQVTN